VAACSKSDCCDRRLTMRNAFLLLLLLCSCIPAKTPPQLNATAGAPVIVTERHIEFEGMQLEYPMGWRVITSAANDPASLVFAAPEDKAIIVLSTIKETTLPELATLETEATAYETVTNANKQFHLWLVSESSSHTDFLPHLQTLLLSISD
jgi:uncharacterized protein YbdZ (MbtH family)